MKKMKNQFEISAGSPVRLGAYRTHLGVNFAINLREGDRAELLLYDRDGEEAFLTIELGKKYQIGLVAAVQVRIPAAKKFLYNYRMNGKVIPDPYARRIFRYGAEGEIRCGIDEQFVSKTEPIQRPYPDCVFYKLHVRGFTKGAHSGTRHPGTFRGVQDKIPYLKKLGVNSVILMPIYEFREIPPETEDDRTGSGPDALSREGVFPRDAAADPETQHTLPEAADEGLPEEILPGHSTQPGRNYWGYTDGLYYVPKLSYCATDDGLKEFGNLVDALHKNQMECILEFYFPEQEPGWKVADILRYWRMSFKVDGFHLVGWGKWIDSVINDPILTFTKLIYVGFDGERIREIHTPLLKNLGEMNQGYQNVMRRFLKGDQSVSESAKEMLLRNPEEFAELNYFADHDGMTLNDIVTYSEKHNEANGEANRDGAPDDYSWNCGLEGETRKRKIGLLRERQLKNAFLILMTSQSPPVIYAGDEFRNSQEGNNNAWCQDNETGWVTWNRRKDAENLKRFVRDAIAFRKEHPILRMPEHFRLMDYKRFGTPDVSFHGKMAWRLNDQGIKNAFGMMYCGQYAEREDGGADDYIYIAYNMHWDEQEFALPDLPKNYRWRIRVETDQEDSFHLPKEEALLGDFTEKHVIVAPRSITILVSEIHIPAKGRKRAESRSGEI